MNPHELTIPRPVQWSQDGRSVLLLDQTLLPRQEVYLRLDTVESVAEAIASLRVRGAPAIGITAALGLAMGLENRLEEGEAGRGEEAGAGTGEADSGEGGASRTPEAPLEEGFLRDLDRLKGTRPTAVNLAWALGRLERAFRSADSAGHGPGVRDRARVEAVRREAEAIAREDQEMCRLIGEHGAGLIPAEGAGVLTHCNAGALATGGMGTALAPLYTAHARGVPLRVYADETRPVLQGARLTAWELHRAGVDVTVLTDSMAGALMKAGKVNLVMVGTDRVAANGDVANKIGTYALAVLAHHHGIPFYVALPRSTFDPEVPDGSRIPIEERDPEELTGQGEARIVPEGVRTWTPAFDVTPAHLVTAFITDGGVLRPPYGPKIARLLEGA